MKKIIKLTEQDLHNIVRKSVNRILRESFGNYDSYVLVDEASEEILGNYGPDEMQDAIDDANNGTGAYLVVGCRNGRYSLDDVVYDSSNGKSYKF